MNTKPNRWLAVILIAHLLIGTLYATQTPAWQAPDEPAHYNYIAHIARGDGLPILAMGDFDLDYNGELISQKFPPEMSVKPIRYESYQPPLYYLIMTPVYGMVAGFGPNNLDEKNGETYGTALIAIRLAGVLLAAISLVLLYTCAVAIFPQKPELALSATAFAATLPMHAAMTAAANNDTLAELLTLASVFVLLRWMRARLRVAADSAAATKNGNTLLLPLGILLGLGLLTKLYVYALLPLCLLMILLITWRTASTDRARKAIVNCCAVLAPALLLGLPMWIRNMRLYGILDPLGLAWHDLVVAGQPTLQDWIVQFGWSAYWERAFTFTFRSFWGVFGWLSVFLDERIYTTFTIFSGVVIFGTLWGAGRVLLASRQRPSSPQFSPFQRWALLFLAAMLLLVAICYILYNTKFVQHQGRYLFWGLLPIGLLVALGWSEVQRRGASIGAALVALLITIWLSTNGASTSNFGAIDKWTVLIGAIFIGLLLLRSLRPTGNIHDRLSTTPVAHPLADPLDRATWLLDTTTRLFPYALLCVVSIITIFTAILTNLSSF